MDRIVARHGSDLIVDLLIDAGVEHVALNPGASFRGLHDSLVHRDDAPAVVLCLHEEICVAIAHGYAKAAGKPMAALLHDIVGLQHASMAIYNAWCDRAPVLVLGGTGPVSKVDRRPWIDWIHTALVQGQQVRDYVKWDDQPADLASVAESFARGWHAACAAPRGPVYLCYDAALQEQELGPELRVTPPSAYPTPTAPALARDELDRLAAELATTPKPIIVTDYAGETERGFTALRALAELLHAPVVDGGARLCFPTRHTLNATGMDDLMHEASLILALDVEDLVGRLGHLSLERAGRRSAGARVINVSPAHLKLRAWAQDYQQLLPVDRHLTADCESVLPDLLGASRERPPAADTLAARRRWLDGRRARQLGAWRKQAAESSARGAIPQSLLAHTLGKCLEGRQWILGAGRLDGWEWRLWPFERPAQHLGWHGGAGMGYSAGAAIGAALGAGPETTCVCLQSDGDLLYTPSALWTAAHESVPVLFVMKNNRQYGNTAGHAQDIARARGRAASPRVHVGADLTDPHVDFAGLARSMGVWGAGPISSPDELVSALDAALAVVERGRPALLDVLVPPVSTAPGSTSDPTARRRQT